MKYFISDWKNGYKIRTFNSAGELVSESLYPVSWYRMLEITNGDYYADSHGFASVERF